MNQHRNHNTGIVSYFCARAVCPFDAHKIAEILRADKDYFDISVTEFDDEATLTFKSFSDSQDAFRDLALAVRDNQPDAHRLVGTFAEADAYTGEVFEMNYFNYNILQGL